jgi:hypothetical protein
MTNKTISCSPSIARQIITRHNIAWSLKLAVISQWTGRFYDSQVLSKWNNTFSLQFRQNTADVCSIPASYSGVPGFRVRLGDRLFEVFRGFLQSHQENIGVLQKNRSWKLSFTSSPALCPPIIVLLDTTQLELLLNFQVTKRSLSVNGISDTSIWIPEKSRYRNNSDKNLDLRVLLTNFSGNFTIQSDVALYRYSFQLPSCKMCDLNFNLWTLN